MTVLFAVILFLLGQKLRAERLAGRQRQLLAEASEIAELKQTISSLLDNMPGIYYTKDANTGEYLACNQAFAEYAHKKDPSEVIGHTAEELFDEVRAKDNGQDNVFMMTFRILADQEPMYVSMKVTRMHDDERFIILSITDVDEQMKQRNAARRMQEEQIAYGRISALAGDYICIYVVEKRIPIIALTANAFDEDVQRSMQAGMNAHLSKPVEADHLIRILGELIYESEKRLSSK